MFFHGAPALAVPYDLWDYQPTVVGDAKTIGMWGAAIEHIPDAQRDPSLHRTEYYPAHGALLREGTRGKLLLWRNQNQDQIILYDLNQSSAPVFYRTDPHTETPSGSYNVHRLYCSAHTPLPDGSLLIAGQPYAIPAPPSTTDGICDHAGNNCDQGGSAPCNCKVVPSPAGASVFVDGPENNGLGRIYRVEDMPTVASGYGGISDSSRYYPAIAPLPSGNVVVAGGNVWREDPNGNCCHTEDPKPYTRTWIEFDATDPFGSPWQVVTNPMDPDWVNSVEVEMAMPFDYGRIFSLPSGLLWLGWPGESYGTASRSSRMWSWPWPVDLADVDPVDRVKVDHRVYSAPVVLSLADPSYASQRILVVGGGDPDTPSNPRWSAEIIDYAAANPQWSLISMNRARSRTHAVLLPDGKVIVVGGTDAPWVPTYDSELFDPTTSQFQVTAAMDKERMYHALAILLPDGRVLAAGNDPSTEYGGFVDGDTYEIYWPPYLFDASNGYASRTAITASDDQIFYGLPFSASFALPSGRSVEEVVLMAPGSVTHGVNFSQRRIVLEHEVTGSTLVATAPWLQEAAPPGDYLLFILDDLGVPSEGRWVRLSRATSTADTGSPEVWSGNVRLGANFTVLPGHHLQILPGTTIYSDAAVGNVKLGIQGRVTADGTTDPITFTSMNGSDQAGEWFGLGFDLVGCQRPSYGYAACQESLSVLKGVTIENASYGVAIQNTCAPSLRDVTFSSITEDRHIYLDGSDVFLTAGFWNAGGTCATCPLNCPSFTPAPAVWELGPGTNVVARNGAPDPGKDATWIGNENRSDLVANAKMEAVGSFGAPVVFRPATPNDATGDDWGGLALGQGSQGSLLDFVDLGHASTPLFAWAPDSGTTIRRTKVHHFADTGLWILETGSAGATVDSCTIERGAGLHFLRGQRGALLDQSGELRFVRNKVDLSGLALPPDSTRAAVDVIFGKTFCQASGGGLDSLVIRECHVLGPGTGTDAAHQGIKSFWVCGSTNHRILFEENYIEGFRTAGLEFSQCSDLQVTCNTVLDNRRAVDLYRDSEPTGSGVRFLKNWLEVNEGNDEMVRSDDLVKTRLGPAGTTLGDNGLAVTKNAASGILEWVTDTDPDPGDQLDARNNYWLLYDTGGWDLVTQVDIDGEPWASRVAPSASSVLYSGFRTNPANPAYCQAEEPPGPPFGTVQGGRHAPVLVERNPEEGSRGEPGTEASALVPRCASEKVPGATFDLVVATGDEGLFRLRVFDVAGRTVVDSDLGLRAVGRSVVRWDGRAADGNVVAGGIYFVRVEGPSFRATRKAVILR